MTALHPVPSPTTGARVFRAVAAAAVVASAVQFAAPSPANAIAGDQGDYWVDGVNIRSGPTTAYTVLGQGYVGKGACLFYAVSGETINGNPWWGYHGNFTTGVIGYSSASLLEIFQPRSSCAFT